MSTVLKCIESWWVSESVAARVCSKSPWIEGRGLYRNRLQFDVFLAVDSVQPDKHMKAFEPVKVL